MQKRAQAALEFLTTYAWAFLVIIIMIGALAYFGVLSPSKLLPDRCTFGSEVGCSKDFLVVDNVATPANTLTMRLENNVGASITITSATVTTDVTTAGTCVAKINDNAISNTAWSSDETITFIVECTTGTSLVPKEKIKFNIEINYFPTAAGLTYAKTVFGEVFTTIQ